MSGGFNWEAGRGSVCINSDVKVERPKRESLHQLQCVDVEKWKDSLLLRTEQENMLIR